jgi:biopolymer transport protein ExbB
VIAFLDNYLPWLVDLLELGGPVLTMILMIAFGIWALLFERLYYFYWAYPHDLLNAQRRWRVREDRTSLFAQQFRQYLVDSLRSGLMLRYDLLATLIKICPLLGLLGTVLGMLEVFDALAHTGSNNPRSMAAGVSKATVTTLAGMVVAIAGLLANSFAERRAAAERERLPGYFESEFRE